jgi:hypothetical protein
MAIEKRTRLPWGILRGPQLLVLFLIGLVLVFIGERMIGGRADSRMWSDLLGGIALLVAWLGWLFAWIHSSGQGKKVERLAAFLSSGSMLAIAIYFIGSDLIIGQAALTGSENNTIGLRQVLAVSWPICLICFLLPLIFVQWSVTSMSFDSVEIARVKLSALSGAKIAIFVSTLFLINAIAHQNDVDIDLKYKKVTAPSEATESLIQGLDDDVRVYLFFPPINEVFMQIEPYFEKLQELSPHLSVEKVDRVMEMELSAKYKVTKDGTVILARKDMQQKIYIGDSMKQAFRHVRKLDGEFQKSMMKLIRQKETVYMISGHGERISKIIEGDPRSPYGLVKKILEANNLAVKSLGVIESLGNQVPEDAAFLLWIDPQTPLFPGEQESIKAYLEKGGRLLVTLGPQAKKPTQEMLDYLGLEFSTAKVAHERAYWRVNRTLADRYNLVTNSFSRHPAVMEVYKKSKLLPVMFPVSGTLKKVQKEKKTKNKVVFIVRSLPDSWIDLDGDFKRSQQERPGIFEIAAAVSKKVSVNEAKEKKKAVDEMRVAVFAGSDVFADDYIGFRVGADGQPGNWHLLAGILQWLTEEGRVLGVAESEEDFKVVLTRVQDVIWFYGMVFVVPLIIIGAGFVTRWGRGRKKKVV